MSTSNRRSQRPNAGKINRYGSDTNTETGAEHVTLCDDKIDGVVQLITQPFKDSRNQNAFSLVQFPLLPCHVCGKSQCFNEYHQYFKCDECFEKTEPFVSIRYVKEKGYALFAKQNIAEGQIIGMPKDIEPSELTDVTLEVYNKSEEKHYYPFFNPRAVIPESMKDINLRYGNNSDPIYLIYAEEPQKKGALLDCMRCLTFASIANSDENPNCEIVYNGKEGIESKAMLIAIKDISTGEEITWTYYFSHCKYNITVIPNKKRIRTMKDAKMDMLQNRLGDLEKTIKCLFHPTIDDAFMGNVMLKLIQDTQEENKELFESIKKLEERASVFAVEDIILQNVRKLVEKAKQQENIQTEFIFEKTPLTVEQEQAREIYNIKKGELEGIQKERQEEQKQRFDSMSNLKPEDFQMNYYYLNGGNVEKQTMGEMFFNCSKCYEKTNMGKLAFYHTCKVMKCLDCIKEEEKVDCNCQNDDRTVHQYSATVIKCSNCDQHISKIKPSRFNENNDFNYFILKNCECDVKVDDLKE